MSFMGATPLGTGELVLFSGNWIVIGFRSGNFSPCLDSIMCQPLQSSVLHSVSMAFTFIDETLTSLHEFQMDSPKRGATT